MKQAKLLHHDKWITDQDRLAICIEKDYILNDNYEPDELPNDHPDKWTEIAVGEYFALEDTNHPNIIRIRLSSNRSMELSLETFKKHYKEVDRPLPFDAMAPCCYHINS